jgi:MFS family permease
MLVYFGTCGDIVYSFGVFLPTMCERLDWSRTTLSGAFTAWLIVSGLFGPLAGITVSKFGARKNIIIGNLVAALGLLGMSIINEVWHVYLFFSVLLGISIAFGEFIPTTAVVNDWFIKRRTLAMSLLVAAGGVGGFAFPPLISWLISSLGWRLGWVYLAGTHIVLAVVMGGILIRSRPEDMGQVPDGAVSEATQEANENSPAPKQVYQTAVDWKVWDALRTRALWMVLIFSAATLFTATLLMIHQVAYLQDLGFSHMQASTTLGFFVGTSIIGRLACGVLGTRFEGRYLAAACLVGLAAGIIVLINARTLPFIYLYATLSGISYGGLIVLMPTMFGAYFGRADYARIMGWTFPIVTLIFAAGPILAGYIYDTTGSYIPGFWGAVAFLGVGLVCALLARPPKPPITVP